MGPRRVKLVIVGDGTVGKTSLLHMFTKQEFKNDYTPTVFENDAITYEIDRQVITLALFDTAGQEDFKSLRPLSYRDADGLILCFSVDNRDSFENVPETWAPEVRYHCPKVPVVLVGTKKDLRNSTSRDRLVQPEEAAAMAERIKASGYLECSAKEDDGVSDVFQTIVRGSLARLRKQRRRCSIM